MDFGAAGPGLTLLGTFGGAWLILRLIRWFQKDFAEEYRRELAEVRAELDATKKELDVERRSRQHAEDRAARYRYMLTVHGIPLDEGPPDAN